MIFPSFWRGLPFRRVGSDTSTVVGGGQRSPLNLYFCIEAQCMCLNWLVPLFQRAKPSSKGSIQLSVPLDTIVASFSVATEPADTIFFAVATYNTKHNSQRLSSGRYAMLCTAHNNSDGELSSIQELFAWMEKARRWTIAGDILPSTLKPRTVLALRLTPRGPSTFHRWNGVGLEFCWY